MSNKFNPAVPAFHPSPSSSLSKLSQGIAQASTPHSSTGISLSGSSVADLSSKTTSRRSGSQPSSASPRNNQSQRPQHKNSRKSSHNDKPLVNMRTDYSDAEFSLIEQVCLVASFLVIVIF